ncbi:MAG TPA: L-lactate dehydrogenase [Clostridiales bacterium]|nr:L-lactate dehydrogenase [Clostridiales bacterium]
MKKIVIVGCGNVGMSYAYAMVVNGVAIDELVLIDINKEKAEGEASDLSHAMSYAPKNFKVFAGDYSDCADATIVCICAGRNQNVGETRTDLINKNKDVFQSVVSEVGKSGFNGIYLVATNPLDIMTDITFRLSGFPSSRVIGSGTTLDSARLRYLVGQKLNISPKSIHGYVIGEHGDSEFIPWNNVMIGLEKAEKFLTKEQMSEIQNEVCSSAYNIIKKKGNTSYGIGMSLLKITNAILDNQNAIISVSAYNKVNDCYFSIPSIVNKSGVSRTLYITLTPEDEKYLLKSIQKIKSDKQNLL